MLTYASETRAETAGTQQPLRTTEMKIIRAVHGKTIGDKIRSDQLRQLSGIRDIIKWANVRRREWGDHVDRMGENRLAKLLEIIVHREYAAEADQRNDGKKVSTQPPRPKLWKNRC